MIKAVIFDMDGVISDTQKIHSRIESNILARFNIFLSPEEITKRYAGVRTKDFFQDLLKTQNKPYDVDELLKEKWALMEMQAEKSIDAVHGSIDLIKNLKSNNFVLAVASASNKDYVIKVLKTLKVFDYFSFIATGDMVSKGKPDPEIFLLAASKIGAQPNNCLVIEDGVSGMQAAKDAGMYCVGLVCDKNAVYPTNNLVSGLDEISLDFIDKLGDVREII